MSDRKRVLTVENLTMQFGGVVAVNNLSAYIDEGEIITFIGPNGAGKTTAFNCVTGVSHPTNGRVTFHDTVIAEGCPTGKMAKTYAGAERGKFQQNIRHTPDEITRMGIARTFQNIRLFPHQTVFDNVLIAQHMRMRQNPFTATFGLNYKEERRAREEVMALLEEQHLAEYADREAGNLSYGLQRHVEIARALATSPTLLFLDEPAAGMNPKETEELAAFVLQIRDKYHLTIATIEHHIDFVKEISDRLYCIEFGKLLADGDPQAVLNDPRVIEAYLGAS